MKRFENILLIHLQAIDLQYFSFLSTHSYGYESPKELRLENQAHTTNFKIHY